MAIPLHSLHYMFSGTNLSNGGSSVSAARWLTLHSWTLNWTQLLTSRGYVLLTTPFSLSYSVLFLQMPASVFDSYNSSARASRKTRVTTRVHCPLPSTGSIIDQRWSRCWGRMTPSPIIYIYIRSTGHGADHRENTSSNTSPVLRARFGALPRNGSTRQSTRGRTFGRTGCTFVIHQRSFYIHTWYTTFCQNIWNEKKDAGGKRSTAVRVR
jgi:hypothetical protein